MMCILLEQEVTDASRALDPRCILKKGFPKPHFLKTQVSETARQEGHLQASVIIGQVKAKDYPTVSWFSFLSEQKTFMSCEAGKTDNTGNQHPVSQSIFSDNLDFPLVIPSVISMPMSQLQ